MASRTAQPANYARFIHHVGFGRSRGESPSGAHEGNDSDRCGTGHHHSIGSTAYAVICISQSARSASLHLPPIKPSPWTRHSDSNPNQRCQDVWHRSLRAAALALHGFTCFTQQESQESSRGVSTLFVRGGVKFKFKDFKGDGKGSWWHHLFFWTVSGFSVFPRPASGLHHGHRTA